MANEKTPGKPAQTNSAAVKPATPKPPATAMNNSSSNQPNSKSGNHNRSNTNSNTSMSNINSRESGEALRLSKLVRELDSNAEVSEEARNLLVKLTDEFIKSVVGSACAIAAHRNDSNKQTKEGEGAASHITSSSVGGGKTGGGGTRLELRDLKFVVERLGILVPGFGNEAPVRSIVATKANAAHKQRQDVKRKALALMTKQEASNSNSSNSNIAGNTTSTPTTGVMTGATATGAGSNKLRKTD